MNQTCTKEIETGETVENTKRPVFKNLRNYFREYCVCSSIHGFRYFGEKRTYFERAWWFFVFTITLSACVILIREVYKKWERSPVIVSFATRETPIYDIPFPAVTICPESKSIQALYNNTEIIRKMLKNVPLNETESRRFDYMSMICNKNFDYSDTETFTDDFFQELERLTIPPHCHLHKCEYMGVEKNCSTLFSPIITDEGICLTFNMLDRSEIYRNQVKHYSNLHLMHKKTYSNWTMDKGYTEYAGLRPYPHRALLAGANNALSITLTSLEENVDYTCKGSLQGFRVILHTPMRVPRPSQQYFRVPLNQFVIASVQPVMIKTSDSVKMYNPKRRECFFPSERKLRYFKIYTQLNCKLECLTNQTLHECGCVNFFMPRDNSSDLCGVGSLDCMKEAERKLQMGILYKKLYKSTNSTKKKKKIKHSMNCDCKPICNDLSYDVETSQSDWDWKKMEKAYEESGNLPLAEKGIHRSQLVVYFKSTQFITYQRQELYGPTDFLANFGGLLGLFTGFSVLSFMEIIYFMTVRLFCNMRLYGFWAGPET